MAWKIVALLIALRIAVAAQGLDPVGHCGTSTSVVVACWDPSAGRFIPERLDDYPEFLPNLHGWDFRINLPHVRFQTLRTGPGSATTMAGVVEDPGPLYKFPRRPPLSIFDAIVIEPPFFDYGHRDNSIWLFRADFSPGTIFYSVLPSRRNRQTGAVENATTLTGAWFRVGPSNGPEFSRDRIAVAVVGRGLGNITIHVVARGRDSHLYYTHLAVDQPHIIQWPTPWQDLGITSAAPPSMVPTGPSGLALAWTDASGNVMVQQLDTTQMVWTPAVQAASGAEQHAPRLVWAGGTLHVFFTANVRLRHTYRTSSSPLAFAAPTNVSSLLPVHEGQFDVMFFNNALHAVVRTETPAPLGTEVFYITTKTPLGGPLAWATPSDTGLAADDAPHIGHLYENVLVLARNQNGRVTYVRKDPNHVDNRITGGALADRWLSAGTEIDPGTSGDFGQMDLLPFNSDLYLTAQRTAGPVSAGTIINFGRAVIKQLFQSKWGMALTYAEEAGPTDNNVAFGGANEIRMLGDFTGDGLTDLIRFPQAQVPGLGPAPVFVRVRQQVPGTSLFYSNESAWHTFFSLKGETPNVGDFNGDQKDDIITFTHHEQRFADGTVIGFAPVWVSLSTGSSFAQSRIWHTGFSPQGEIPLVGDFDGDGKADIVTFVQHPQSNPDGSPIGAAPVWVALSNGSRFGAAAVWQTNFSPQGEVPMVGDFNGDGKADIVSFARRAQFAPDGTLIGHAPVHVALSTGTSFGESRLWHTFFALDGEVPRVADVDMDGKDDIVTFLHGTGDGSRKNNVYVAFSTGTRFQTSVTWMSNQASPGQTPFAGSANGTTLSNITGRPQDRARRLPDLFVFDDATGKLRIAPAMARIPYAVGAPWERYRFFTNKGIGAAQFPEWIYETGPNHCLSQPFRFILNGAAGVGAADFMISSVRPGGGAGHILEEMGHSVFANCMRQAKDPFHLFDLIYKTPMSSGGLDANQMPGCDGSFDDCRDPEHFFLQLIKKYRLAGDEFRSRIIHPRVPEEHDRRLKQYLWLKQHWYEGAEFKLGALEDVSVYPEGVLCLPGECSLTGPEIAPADRGGTASGCQMSAAQRAPGQGAVLVLGSLAVLFAPRMVRSLLRTCRPVLHREG